MLSMYGLDAHVMGRLDALHALIDEATTRQVAAMTALADARTHGTPADVGAAQDSVRLAAELVMRSSERYRMSLRALDPQSQQDYLRLRQPETLVSAR